MAFDTLGNDMTRKTPHGHPHVIFQLPGTIGPTYHEAASIYKTSGGNPPPPALVRRLPEENK